MGIGIRINCVYNDRGAWCKNKKIKRKLGFLARVCLEFPGEKGGCPYITPHERPDLVPTPRPPRKI
jgi:hypothetical protein